MIEQLTCAGRIAKPFSAVIKALPERRHFRQAGVGGISRKAGTA